MIPRFQYCWPRIWAKRLQRPQPSGRAPKLASHAILGAAILFGFVALAASEDRLALWRVVQACVADYQFSGAAFPCLAVNLSDGVDRGYVLLRSPVGEPDTILAPTRKVVGVEDDWLRSPNAPNYFAAALEARGFVKGAAPSLNEVALAVNSRGARTQDQLHIHIGCLSARVRGEVQGSAAALPVREWERVRALPSGRELWAWRTGQSDLVGVEPFRLTAATLPAMNSDPSALMIAVAGVRVGGADELVILAAAGGARGARHPVSSDEIVDPICARHGGGT